MAATDAQAASTDGTHAAFVYGTLMAPEVFFTVCYRFATDNVALLKSLHEFKPAVLHGYCRRRVQYADYPGIVPEEGHSVRGMYVTGLTGANLAKLDQFEGSEYERRTVKARLLKKKKTAEGGEGQEGKEEEEEGEEEVECGVYVFLNPRQLEDREWDFEEFRTQRMKLWTREDYGFADTDHLAAAADEAAGGPASAAVCEFHPLYPDPSPQSPRLPESLDLSFSIVRRRHLAIPPSPNTVEPYRG